MRNLWGSRITYNCSQDEGPNVGGMEGENRKVIKINDGNRGPQLVSIQLNSTRRATNKKEDEDEDQDEGHSSFTSDPQMCRNNN